MGRSTFQFADSKQYCCAVQGRESAPNRGLESWKDKRYDPKLLNKCMESPV